MDRDVDVKCPYCHTLHYVTMKSDHIERKVVICYPEEGGCDRYYVVKIEVQLTAQTFKVEEAFNDHVQRTG